MADHDDADAVGPQRDLPALWAWGAGTLAVVIALGHIYLALSTDLSQLMRNALHFAGFVILAGLYYPLRRGLDGPAWRIVDLALGLAVAAAALWMAFAEDAIYARGVRLSMLDWIAGCVVILGAIEFARRVAGPVIPILIVLSLSYIVLWGAYIPGVFRFAGLTPETVLFRSIYGDDAIFGTIARISATYVFPFILFGAFLVRSGAGEFVIELAQAVAGRLAGGPGLVAVIASALTGTISGSAVANTASTGVVTIPLMKSAGFPPRFAAAVEASASTGGQLMPPIMGAGAFVMASYTQIPYETIIAVAALPAFLYFASVAFFVRIEAVRSKLAPAPYAGPGLWAAVKARGASFILPIALLITLLIMRFTPAYAAVIGIGAVVASSWLTRTPMGPRAVIEALIIGSRNMIMTAVLLCAVGLVVNVIATAGIGNTFSLMISGWANGNILIAIVLIGLASLVLGMGLPVTAAYIVLATLSAPALAQMIGDAQLLTMVAGGGLPPEAAPILMLAAPDAAVSLGAAMPVAEAKALLDAIGPELRGTLRDLAVSPAAATTALLSAHMIIFWLSQDSNVTPPVCLAAFTAAAIAKSPPMATGLTSWRVAKGLYIVPVLFAYTPILSGNWGAALEVTLFAFIGVYALAAAMGGAMETVLGWPARALAALAGIACLWPDERLLHLAGAAVAVALFIWTIRRSRGQGSTALPA